MLHILHFFSSKFHLFHNSTFFGSCIIHILHTGCAKIKKKKSRAKGLNLLLKKDKRLTLRELSARLNRLESGWHNVISEIRQDTTVHKMGSKCPTWHPETNEHHCQPANCNISQKTPLMSSGIKCDESWMRQCDHQRHSAKHFHMKKWSWYYSFDSKGIILQQGAPQKNTVNGEYYAKTPKLLSKMHFSTRDLTEFLYFVDRASRHNSG
jgi:hypothetical protein